MVTHKARQIINSIKPNKIPKSYTTPLGEIGYDNARDDIEKIKNIREGTVVKTPTNDLDIANKKYVDDTLTNGYVPYTGADSNVDLGSYDLITTGDLKIDNVYEATANNNIIFKDNINISRPNQSSGQNILNNSTVLYSGSYSKYYTTDASLGNQAGIQYGNSIVQVTPTYISQFLIDRVNYEGIYQANLLTIDLTNDKTTIHGDLQINGQFINEAGAVEVLAGQKISYEAAGTNHVTFTPQSDGDMNVTSNKASYNVDWNDANISTTGNITGSNLNIDNWDTAYTHSQDNTQAHSDYLLNSEADVGVGLTLTGDNSSADTAYVPMVLYNTDANPPAASGFPIGTIYIQYTA